MLVNMDANVVGNSILFSIEKKLIKVPMVHLAEHYSLSKNNLLKQLLLNWQNNLMQLWIKNHVSNLIVIKFTIVRQALQKNCKLIKYVGVYNV